MKKAIRFGTDGWRDIIADGFTFDNVKIVSKAIGSYIKNQGSKAPLLIGYDTRFLSKEFALYSAQVINELGIITKISTEPTPTPVIAFYAHAWDTSGAIQFTASHNPPQYNGIKFITSYGGPASVDITNEITRLINTEILDIKTQHSKFVPKEFESKKDYISHLKKLISFEEIKKAKIKVVYDPMFGAGKNYLDLILKEAGCIVTTIHNENDPTFSGLLPEPKEKFLGELKKSVLENNASIGIATDGDGDRIGITDEAGNYYTPNKIASMLLRHLVKNKKLKGTVVRTLSTTHLLDSLAKAYNLDLVETKVGFKWIAEIMRQKQVIIGAEESGGISILNHIPDKDAMLAGLLIVEMISMEKRTISEIYKETLHDAGWSSINDNLDISINENKKQTLVNAFSSGKINIPNSLKLLSINTNEGAKYLFDDGSWFLARASGTEPLFRFSFEATTQKSLEMMKEGVQKVLNEI